jgi:pentose-5-phosphate-3-epimerase
VDGGISLENCREVYLAGADVLVSGNAVMGAADPSHVIQEMILRCTDSQIV